MVDLVERLRQPPVFAYPAEGQRCKGVMEEAAQEIERLRRIEELYEAGTKYWGPVYEVVLNERSDLRAENERLREVLNAAEPVYATAKNSADVRKGYAMSGHVRHYTVPSHVMHKARAALAKKED